MKSPVTWLTDKEYADAPLKERAVAQADSYVGSEEQGHNAGPFVTMLLKAIGLGPGYAWCGAFVSWCLVRAGFLGGPKFGRGRVKNWVDWAHQNGRLYYSGPKRGDLFAWVNDDLTGHIGFVLSIPDFDGRFRTIEGNTNSAGSRDGDCVMKRSRTLGKRMMFLRWWE